MVESIRTLTEELIALHRREIEAVRNWDIDSMERIDQELEKANEQRDALLENLNSHVKAHGCHGPQAQGLVQGCGARPVREELSEPDGEGARGGEETDHARKGAASEAGGG